MIQIFPYFLLFSYIFANFAVEYRENGQHLGNSNGFDCSLFAPSLHRIIDMSEKFPYGYDVNAYIDKAFEQMKADFPCLVPPGSFYVDRADLERDPRIKEFLGF